MHTRPHSIHNSAAFVTNRILAPPTFRPHALGRSVVVKVAPANRRGHGSNTNFAGARMLNGCRGHFDLVITETKYTGHFSHLAHHNSLAFLCSLWVLDEPLLYSTTQRFMIH